jgi:hypothetical protein
MSDLKLGKREATTDARDLLLSNYLDAAVALPEPPKVFGFGRIYSDWGMLGNNQYGDCVFAGSDHETMLWNKVRHGHDVEMSADAALADYSDVTGFNPNDPNTDQGTYVRDALKYRKATGVRDALGNRHKIAAYVALSPKDWHQLLTASYIFGAVGMGFEFPNSAMDQFYADEPWDVVPGATIEGGHYVPVVGTTNSVVQGTCITWAKRQVFTRAFYETYNDEAWAMLSEEQIRSDGTGLHGLNLEQLKADLAAL